MTWITLLMFVWYLFRMSIHRGEVNLPSNSCLTSSRQVKIHRFGLNSKSTRWVWGSLFHLSTWIFQACKICAFSPEKPTKGRNFTKLEDPGIILYPIDDPFPPIIVENDPSCKGSSSPPSWGENPPKKMVQPSMMSRGKWISRGVFEQPWILQRVSNVSPKTVGRSVRFWWVWLRATNFTPNWRIQEILFCFQYSLWLVVLWVARPDQAVFVWPANPVSTDPPGSAPENKKVHPVRSFRFLSASKGTTHKGPYCNHLPQMDTWGLEYWEWRIHQWLLGGRKFLGPKFCEHHQTHFFQRDNYLKKTCLWPAQVVSIGCWTKSLHLDLPFVCKISAEIHPQKPYQFGQKFSHIFRRSRYKCLKCLENKPSPCAVLPHAQWNLVTPPKNSPSTSWFNGSPRRLGLVIFYSHWVKRVTVFTHHPKTVT